MKALNKKSKWYKNCVIQRKKGAKICNDCPFREDIEYAEKYPPTEEELRDRANRLLDALIQEGQDKLK